MNDEHPPPDGVDAISADDAERLLAGADLEPDGAPMHAMLHDMFTSARSAGDERELTQVERVVAAFIAARAPVREIGAGFDERRRAITRRTLAIIGIATGASLTAALAAGAVGNPFTSPVPADRAPATTSLPLPGAEPASTALADPGSLEEIPTTTGEDLRSGAATEAQPPSPVIGDARAGVEPAGASPAQTAPGQVGQTPSVTAPGQVGQTPSGTAPGQVGQTPSVTAPGQVGQTPSVTALGQVGQTPSVTAPGQVGQTPSGTAPGQSVEHPSATNPSGRTSD